MHDTFSPLPHMSRVASPHFKTAFCSTFSHFSSWLSWVLPTHCPNLPHPLYPFQSARIYFFSPRGTDRFKQPFFIFSRYSSPFMFKTHSKPNCLKYFEPFFLFLVVVVFFFPLKSSAVLFIRDAAEPCCAIQRPGSDSPTYSEQPWKDWSWGSSSHTSCVPQLGSLKAVYGPFFLFLTFFFAQKLMSVMRLGTGSA